MGGGGGGTGGFAIRTIRGLGGAATGAGGGGDGCRFFTPVDFWAASAVFPFFALRALASTAFATAFGPQPFELWVSARVSQPFEPLGPAWRQTSWLSRSTLWPRNLRTRRFTLTHLGCCHGGSLCEGRCFLSSLLRPGRTFAGRSLGCCSLLCRLVGTAPHNKTSEVRARYRAVCLLPLDDSPGFIP